MTESGYFTLVRAKGESTKAQKTYFFKNPKNDRVVPTMVKEAHFLVTSNSPMKLVGVSDGTTYKQKIREAMERQDSALHELDASDLNGRDYSRKRQVIADRAKKDLVDAQMAEQEAAMGNIEEIPDQRGILFGDAKYSKAVLDRMMG